MLTILLWRGQTSIGLRYIFLFDFCHCRVRYRLSENHRLVSPSCSHWIFSVASIFHCYVLRSSPVCGRLLLDRSLSNALSFSVLSIGNVFSPIAVFTVSVQSVSSISFNSHANFFVHVRAIYVSVMLRSFILYHSVFVTVTLAGMTKYHRGPQNTIKDRKGALHRIAKDPQRTAKEHYGLGCRKLAPIEISGALYSSARQDSSKLAHSLQCLFFACLVVTSCWFALSKSVSYEMKIIFMLLALLLLLPIDWALLN